jgi:hypothetical protein
MELESEPKHDGNDFAIQHYNKAIKHIIMPREANLDTVLLVCILLVCIESALRFGLPRRKDSGMINPSYSDAVISR